VFSLLVDACTRILRGIDASFTDEDIFKLGEIHSSWLNQPFAASWGASLKDLTGLKDLLRCLLGVHQQYNLFIVFLE
jgi:hypothetical protein